MKCLIWMTFPSFSMMISLATSNRYLDLILMLVNWGFLVWTNAGSHQILHTVAKSKRQVAGGMNHIGRHFLELINGVYER
jgi:hypothetical protein